MSAAEGPSGSASSSSRPRPGVRRGRAHGRRARQGRRARRPAAPHPAGRPAQAGRDARAHRSTTSGSPSRPAPATSRCSTTAPRCWSRAPSRSRRSTPTRRAATSRTPRPPGRGRGRRRGRPERSRAERDIADAENRLKVAGRSVARVPSGGVLAWGAIAAAAASGPREPPAASCVRSAPWRGRAHAARAGDRSSLITRSPRAKALLGLAPQPRPRVGAGPAPRERASRARARLSRCASSARERERVRHPCAPQIRRSVTAKSRPALARMNSTEWCPSQSQIRTPCVSSRRACRPRVRSRQIAHTGDLHRAPHGPCRAMARRVMPRAVPRSVARDCARSRHRLRADSSK